MYLARIPTGVEGLDEILYGGFEPLSSYLLVGGPGTGKTVLALQFLHSCAKRGERCLLVTLAEPEGSLRRTASVFGWSLDGVEIEDLSGRSLGKEVWEDYTVFSPEEVEAQPVWATMFELLDRHKPDRLVLDSATALRYLIKDEYLFRRQVQGFVNRLAALGCLSLFLLDPSEAEKNSAWALAADGVLALRRETSENRLAEIRTVEVQKMRRSPFLPGYHAFRITPRGIQVWPHRIEKLKRYTFERENLSSGIRGLDELLAGGLPSGGCTLISGPAGVGKSTLAAQYLATAAAEGKKGVLYTFEEGLSSILDRCRSVGLPLERYLEDERILVREINPLEQYPDEFLALLRNDLEQLGARLFVLDSLRGLHLAMESFGSILATLQNMINYVRRNHGSLFLLNEQERITGDLQLTDFGVSYVADNILLLRYAEIGGRVVKVISCLKKRVGGALPEIREFRISERGFEVGDPIHGLQGLLTGLPTWEGDAGRRETSDGAWGGLGRG